MIKYKKVDQNIISNDNSRETLQISGNIITEGNIPPNPPSGGSINDI